MEDLQKVTIYTPGSFVGCINKIEAKLVEYGRMKYAQYDNAVFVAFIKKGKRTKARIVEGYNPYILIIKGWDGPEPDSMLGEPKAGNVDGVTVRESRYSSFDPRWRTDFDELIAKSDVEIIVDYRTAEVNS